MAPGALLLLGSLAGAGAASPERTGFLIGEDLRYSQASLPRRVLADAVAMPAGMARWDGRDWLLAGAVGGATLALMAPTDPSPDVRIDRWAIEELDPWLPDIWGVEMQTWLWSSMAVTGLGTWGGALIFGHDSLAESMSLSVEALGVGQLYHLGFKMMIGREGPRDGDGLGLVLGPTASWGLFPAGTPSGHFLTFYALLAVQLRYWEPHWAVRAASHLVVGSLASMHVLNHRHYLSDILWGSAMGYAMGDWVVRHRSTRYRYNSAEPVRVVLQPWRDAGTGATGLALGARF